jgi:SP family arabinose:H+ symporter-like MFS transporter
MVHGIGADLTFGVFAFFCVVAWIWIYFAVPETKGLSLEQIQELWKAPAA